MARHPPPKIAEDTSPGRWPPARMGRGAATKTIIQCFFCVVNAGLYTALLPHFGAVVIPHFLPHFQNLPHFAPLTQQNTKARKAFNYAVF